ncbi:unnamed protein product [marine sediment metagenome]|uniref:Uncharacterized protein n=1 Tax=marine sediment metagenome TaxID=412755 RepID=X0TXP7_9ZZZZ
MAGNFHLLLLQGREGAGTDITRGELDAKVAGYIKKLGYGQVPQLEGTKLSIGEGVFT